MAKHIPTIALPSDAYLNILIYGNPGVGKTTFCATAQDHPAMRDVLFLNMEGGMLSVAKRGDVAKVDVNSAKALEEVFWDFINHDPDYLRFKTVVLDSGTETQNKGLEDLVLAAINDPKSNREDRDDIFLADYGKSNTQLTRLFRWFRDAPVHFLMTALPKPVYPRGNKGQPNENAQPIEILPSFTAKLAETAQGFMDFVWYMYQDGEGKRCILTQNQGLYRAKTRGAAFSELITAKVENPTLPDLYEKFLTSEMPGLDTPAMNQVPAKA